MIRRRSTVLAAIFVAVIPTAQGQPTLPEWAERLVLDVRSSSFPELADKDIRVGQFASDSDYFQGIQAL